MTAQPDSSLILFRPGRSLLHRLDPRLKLLAATGLIVAAFAARRPAEIGLLLLLGAVAVTLAGGARDCWWRGVRSLRWLLLATLGLHLLFSPGQTLFGLAWLSADGLRQGVLICLQLVLAMTFSLLLTLTTAPLDLGRALYALLRPLETRGLPVRSWLRTFLLTLHFLPLLRQEARAARRQFPAGASRWQRSAGIVMPLLRRLVDRADVLARRQVAGEDVLGEEAARSALPPPAGEQLLALAGLGAALVVAFGAGR